MENFELNLFLFDGEGGAAAEAAAAPSGKNALADVSYGVQEEATEPTALEPAATEPTQTEHHATADTAEARRADFEKLIKGEYKDLYGESMQQAISARFKETKQAEERMNALKPILQTLSGKYGVDANDVDALGKAISEDDSYYEDEAERKGLTVEQLKQMKRMEAENEQLRQAVEERNQREFANRQYAQWMEQSDECQRFYPGFDFEVECGSEESGERFIRMLRNGIDVKTAYEVLHKDELLGGAIQYAVQETQKRTVDNIRARGMRPAENGASGSAPAKTVKSSVDDWTKQDLKEVHRRVMRGERIVPGGS